MRSAVRRSSRSRLISPAPSAPTPLPAIDAGVRTFVRGPQVARAPPRRLTAALLQSHHSSVRRLRRSKRALASSGELPWLVSLSSSPSLCGASDCCRPPWPTTLPSAALKIAPLGRAATPEGRQRRWRLSDDHQYGHRARSPDRRIERCLIAQFEIHSMKMDNGVMKMRLVTGGLEIKPGRTVKLRPSGYHVMFVGLKKPLDKGRALRRNA